MTGSTTLRRQARRACAVALACAAVALGAGGLRAPAALGAQVPAAAAGLPLVQAELWPDHQEGLATLIVFAELPPTVKLPAKVRLPLPPDASLTWSGEIDVSDMNGAHDTTLTPHVVEVSGGRVVELDVKRSRAVQYEAVLGRSVRKGDTTTTLLDWTQTAPTGAVTFSTRIPIDATNVVITPAPSGDPQRDEQLGQMLYTLEPRVIPVGRRFPFQVVYTTKTGTAGSATATATPAGGGPGVPTWIIVLLVAAIAMLPVVYGVQRRRRASAGDGS